MTDSKMPEPAATTRDIVRAVWGLCEALEDEAYDKLKGDLTDHEKGFWSAQKMTAKRIRRATEMPAHPAPVADAELDGLIEDLEAGVRSCGLHDDNSTEMFLVDDSSEVMWNAAAALRARTAQPVGVRVKPLEWEADPYNEGDYQFWRAKAGEYIYEVGCDRTYWWQEDGAANICAIDGFPSGDAAKAAAQADHDQRIRSQIIAAPITVQDAAKVLLSPDENGNRTGVYDACAGRVKVYKFDAVLRALLSEGGA